MPSGTPISRLGIKLARTRVRCCSKAALNTSWRLAYSLSSDNASSMPEAIHTTTGRMTAALASNRHAGFSCRCPMASVAASQASAASTQKAPPNDVRSIPALRPVAGSAAHPASCRAWWAASQTRPVSSALAATATRICSPRRGRMKMAAPSSSAGPSVASSIRACDPPSLPRSTSVSEIPRPDTSRLGAWVKNASPVAAATPNTRSNSKTRFWTRFTATVLAGKQPAQSHHLMKPLAFR